MIKLIFQEIFAPVRCIACQSREEKSILCGKCSKTIPIHETFFCGLCRARLPSNQKICHQNFPYLLCPATDYKEPITRTLIHRLKFARDRDAAKPLAQLLIQHITETNMDYRTCEIIPIPLSKRRERSRGFNQSELIAKHISDKLKIPLNKLLLRTRHSSPQSETNDADERAINVKGAFDVRSMQLCPKKIILLDDVTTSGATFREAATTLKKAGARTIYAVAVAKA